jgi:hypothetical protein
MTHTKQSIQELLLRNDEIGMHAVGRALVALAARQTEYERQTETTINRNYRGFTPNDAKFGTSMAGYYERNGRLTQPQLDYWQKPGWTEKKRIRITKYWAQLLIVAEDRAKARMQAELALAA